MDNLNSPAYPVNLIIDEKQNAYVSSLDLAEKLGGFTKLEKAALMIAQGFLSGDPEGYWKPAWLATQSVEFAKAILEEANK